MTTNRKHLHTQEALAVHVGSTTDHMSRGHHQGNGLRVHGIYFVAVSLVALVLLIAVIAIASAM